MHRPQMARIKQYREMQKMVERLKGEKESLMQRYNSLLQLYLFIKLRRLFNYILSDEI